LSIGRYPEISLADARGIATIKCAEAMQGRNPAADKQKAKAAAAKDWTVREIEASDVVALIEASSLTWGESNMLLITTKCLFTHACGKRLVSANPCYGIMLSEAVNFSLLRHNRRDRTLAPAWGEIFGMHVLTSCSAWIYPFSALFPRLSCHLRYCGRSCPQADQFGCEGGGTHHVVRQGEQERDALDSLQPADQ